MGTKTYHQAPNNNQNNNISTRLISVIVLSYNSSDTIIDTLDSILKQDYTPIELIISDDCSTDKTVELTNNWIAKHKHRFLKIKTLTAQQNRGITANLSAAILTANGDYIKPIAADDVLNTHSLTALSVALSSGFDIAAGKAEACIFESNALKPRYIFPSTEKLASYQSISNKDLSEIVACNPFAAPAVMYRKSSYFAASGIDERFKHLEDWPLWVRIFQNGGRAIGVDDVVVRYRISPKSISNQSITFKNKDYLYDLFNFYFWYQLKHSNISNKIVLGVEAIKNLLAATIFHKRPNAYRTTRALNLLSRIFIKNK